MGAMFMAPDFPEIDPLEAQERIAAGVLHVDVREEDEIRAKRIAGGVALPLSVFLERYEAELPKDAPILVSCRSGARSGRVVQFLIEQGYDATNLGGGLIAWEGEGLPVEQG